MRFQKILLSSVVLFFVSVTLLQAHTALAQQTNDPYLFVVLSSNKIQDAKKTEQYLSTLGEVKQSFRPHYIIASIDPTKQSLINDPNIISVFTDSVATTSLPTMYKNTDFALRVWNDHVAKINQANAPAFGFRALLAPVQQLATSDDPADNLEIDYVDDLAFPDTHTLPAQEQSLPDGMEAASVPVDTGVPVLNSLPGAFAKLYLDFNGDPNNHNTPAYDIDGDATTFSDQEQANIREIWARVAEKYEPFNINVTTVDPGNENRKETLRVLIGGDSSWVGQAAGGTAAVGEFYDLGTTNTVWVFPVELGNGFPKYVAEAAAHEAGHGFGLRHHSTYSGTTQTNVYDPGDSFRAPIMGNSYSAQRGLWFNSATDICSTCFQPDTWYISSDTDGFGYRTDEDGGTPGTAATLSIAGGTTISGWGVIASSTDADYYSFTSGAGAASFTAAATTSGPTLDLSLQIRDNTDALIAEASTTSFGETLNTTLTAGTHYLVVRSAGRYGDLGQYTLSGTIPAVSADVTAPIISVIASGTPTATSATITWTTDEASDSQINYGLSSSYNASTTLNSSLTTSHSVTILGLSPTTLYHFRVRSTDAAGNLAVSADQNVTTAIDAVNPVPVITSATPSSGAMPLLVSFNGSGSTDNVLLNKLVWDFGDNSATTSATTTSHTYITAGTYTAILTAVDATGNVASATATITVTPTYTASVSATNGTVSRSPNQTTYAPNTSVTLTATPSAGYSFTGWVGDATGSTSPTTITLNIDKFVTALFLLNNPPTVSAGSDQGITLPTDTVTLLGTSSDDLLPYGNAVVTTWSKTSGPGSVTFGNIHATSTTATFSASGSYVLTLSSTDGAETTSSNITITVNAAPGSGGGGGGGGSSYVSPSVILTSVASSTLVVNPLNALQTSVQYTTLLSGSLSAGITSPQVTTLQKFLASQGPTIYPNPQITGYYGTLTTAAVKNFQKAHGLTISGSVNAQTLAEINILAGPQAVSVPTSTLTSNTSNVLSPSGTITLNLYAGLRNTQVTLLQQFLATQGSSIYPDPQITGYFGSLTTAAVKRFQKKYGIEQTGNTGPITRAKINSLLK